MRWLIGSRRIQGTVPQQRDDNCREWNDGWVRSSGRLVLGLIGTGLDAGAIICFAVVVLMGRFAGVLAAGKEFQTGNHLQLAMVRHRQPYQRRQDEQCFP